MAEAAGTDGGFNLNPALRSFFNFNANGQPQQSAGDAEQQGGGTAPLLGVLRPDLQPPQTIAGHVKNFLRLFALYFVVGIIGAILVHSMAVILVVTVVVLFVVVQILTASGMVAINWTNVKASMIRRVDRDGDGTFGWSDLKGWCIAAFTFVVGKGVPAVAGLLLGGLVGWKFS